MLSFGEWSKFSLNLDFSSFWCIVSSVSELNPEQLGCQISFNNRNNNRNNNRVTVIE
ncbi:hypothetical protein IFVP203_C1220091 [Vibrio parahaemolyticus]